jgi:hypothetical protein
MREGNGVLLERSSSRSTVLFSLSLLYRGRLQMQILRTTGVSLTPAAKTNPGGSHLLFLQANKTIQSN